MTTKEDRFARIKKGLAKRGKILFYASCICTVTGFLGRYFMVFELTSHFRVQYFLILLISAIVYGCRKKWKHLAAALFFLIVNGAVIIPWYLLEKEPNTIVNHPPVRILFANVHTSNNDYSSLLELIEKESPDIIALQEVDEKWANAVKGLCPRYPFHEFCPRSDNFGLAVLSKISLRDIQVKSFCKVTVPTIVAAVETPASPFTLIITHPVPPAIPSYYSLRNEQLAQIAEYVRTQKGPSVIVGDLNLTMWSWYHDKLLAETGMKNARRGFGINPTWPTLLPPLYIPLDHCLCTSSIQVLSFRTTARIGSDHLPCVVDLLIPKEKESPNFSLESGNPGDNIQAWIPNKNLTSWLTPASSTWPVPANIRMNPAEPADHRAVGSIPPPCRPAVRYSCSRLYKAMPASMIAATAPSTAGRTSQGAP